MKKKSHPLLIVFTGPESCGKTTIGEAVANHFKLPLVEEFAREYLNRLEGKYTYDDLEHIAEGQYEAINERMIQANRKGCDGVIADTDLLTIYIWSKVRYGKVAPYIRKMLMCQMPDFYLLMAPDIMWEPDKLREDEHNRNELFAIYKALIEEMKVPYTVIEGEGEVRLQNTISALRHFLSGKD